MAAILMRQRGVDGGIAAKVAHMVRYGTKGAKVAEAKVAEAKVAKAYVNEVNHFHERSESFS